MKNSTDKVSNTLTINVNETHEVKIMKTLRTSPPGLLQKVTGATAVILLSALLLPGTAFADMAANAVIRNTATVDYEDTAGNAQPQISDSVDVTVNLVTAHPTLSDETTATTPSGVTVDYTYTITSNSNGLDNYGLTSATSAVGGGIGGLGTIEFRDYSGAGPITDIDLGASTVAAIATAGSTVIIVPNDGAADGSINGINANAGSNTVVINGTTYTVASITDNATGPSTITLTAGLAADVAVGDNIFQQKQFILRATPTTTVSGDTYTVTVTADDGVTAGAAPSDDTITTVTLISLSVVKYVANITTGAAGGGATVGPFTTGLGAANVTYYESGVTANPGDILEYVIAVTNAAGSGTADNVIITDPVPAFTSLTGNVALDDGGGAFAVSAGTAVDDRDFVETDGTTVYIYAGSGGDDDPGGAGGGLGAGGGGSLPASTTTYGAFRVQVTP